MKTKFLFFLLAIFVLHSCMKEEIDSTSYNQNIEKPTGLNKVADPIFEEWTVSVIDIYYNTELSIKEINDTRDYYFTKYHQNHIETRLSMYDILPNETHHEQWLWLESIIDTLPGGDELEDDIEDDPNLQM